jgi:hypothetical protein
MALIVSCFVGRGLLEALVEVIVTGDTFISVRGTVLLGELLSLLDRYIPLDCYDPSACIPTLIRYSAGVMSSSAEEDQGQGSLPAAHEWNTNSTGGGKGAAGPANKPASAAARQQRAMEAINVLSSLQRIKSRPPSASSVFLQAQLMYAGYLGKGAYHGKFQDRLGQLQLSRVSEGKGKGDWVGAKVLRRLVVG